MLEIHSGEADMKAVEVFLMSDQNDILYHVQDAVSEETGKHIDRAQEAF